VDFEFVLEQLLLQLGGDVLVLEAAHFGEELVAQDADVRLGQSGGGEDVDHLAFGGDGLAHELADGGVDLLGRLLVAAALLVQRGLQGLEKGNVIADLRGFIAGGAEGKGAGKLRHHLHPALLAVFLFEDVFLPGGDEGESFGEFAGGPLGVLLFGVLLVAFARTGTQRRSATQHRCSERDALAPESRVRIPLDRLPDGALLAGVPLRILLSDRSGTGA
jgi:hypothetical protein